MIPVDDDIEALPAVVLAKLPSPSSGNAAGAASVVSAPTTSCRYVPTHI